MNLDALRRELLGALIGLARTCSNNPPTGQTGGLLLAGLHAADPATPVTDDQLIRLIARVRADKAAVSPNCISCAAPCGKNADYDWRRVDAAAPDVRQSKQDLLHNLQQLGHRGRLSQTVYDSLFALAEDWDAGAYAWYLDATEKELAKHGNDAGQ